jgi:opacity protein-like surface antigen
MRIREAAIMAMAMAVALLAAPRTRAAAQATRDRPTLVFTISGAYIDGGGIWSVADQPITDLSAGGAGLTDHFMLSRSVKRTLGAAFSATYFKGKHLGITGEGMLLGLGYEDACGLRPPVMSALNQQRCNSLPELDRSAAAVALSAGVVYRIAPVEFISPFARAGVGLLINNQSPLLMVAEDAEGADFTIYDDPQKGTRLRPAFTLGVGTTIAVGRAYHLRWEIRDNILGIQRVTGPDTDRGEVPPHKTAYKNLFSLIVGLDVILERRPGRRY